ncbi:hypothetical protein BDW75DRAFT_231591 [Aspergillus navahoensis]
MSRDPDHTCYNGVTGDNLTRTPQQPNIATAPLAVSVPSAGGLGFLAGVCDVSSLESNLEKAAQLIKQSNPAIQQVYAASGILPIGVGFLNWGADLAKFIAAIAKIPDDLCPCVEQVRAVTDGKTTIWVQVGTVSEEVAVAESLDPDVLVVKGSDAGGHGLAKSAYIITLVPEVKDALGARQLSDHIPLITAGGIVDGRGVAASLALGASDEVLPAFDGDVSTIRSTVYDRVRGILGWPSRYDRRGVINQSYIYALERDISDEENKALYEEELKNGVGMGPKC